VKHQVVTPRQQGEATEQPRFVVLVDHQPKRGFELREDADQEARRILERFPHLNVTVENADSLLSSRPKGWSGFG
jgi:hypothetical protein